MKPYTAAGLMSFIFPGIGQLYNKQYIKAILFFVIHYINFQLIFTNKLGFGFYLIAIVWSVYDAYHVSKQKFEK
ncbi:DUF5683 domain-containing protein [Chengkuizengella axinellae]|uniref:DUF5683 domain-containing protein n=1 Tax=Chengkuizengella axinellae TaxID=3064388 RepID=A0ABT9J3N8_9BACL|nr:DUF5683 domain-containing protein [Chengkuizengella sp. 2205SS18-9]MDP5276103.1 hypothetical protein [Chengkuizengella sp. 2205SS18-9]